MDTKEVWLDQGRQLRERYHPGAAQWAIGDWLNRADSRWGEMYSPAAKVLGRSEGTLRNCKSVAAKFDLSRRRDDLSFAHHAAVAKLRHAKQDRLLDQAAAERLSVPKLRAIVNQDADDPKVPVVLRVSEIQRALWSTALDSTDHKSLSSWLIEAADAYAAQVPPLAVADAA